MEDKPKLILIFGASGSGKTTLLRELLGNNLSISIHQKGTDRPPKKYDSDEIRCVEKVNDEEYDFIYQQYGYRYGIQRKQIEQAFIQGKDHYIICNDIQIIKKLKNEYDNIVYAIFLLFNAPKEQIELVQKARGITDDQLNLRLAKIRVLNELFLENFDLFNGIVINKIGAPAGNMVNQVNFILGKSGPKASEIVSDIVEIISVIRKNLEILARDTLNVTQPGYLFILMAMIDAPLLDDTHSAIKRSALKCGLRGERVDDIAFTEQITSKVLGSIRQAEFIVADITHERPNVYYEIGYAHAFGKPTILTARHNTKLHFDIQGFPIIFYKSATELEDKLIRFFESYQSPE